jgi:hypothetical protein
MRSASAAPGIRFDDCPRSIQENGVMRGLDPHIHLLREKFLRSGMDRRVKPGDDRVVRA